MHPTVADVSNPTAIVTVDPFITSVLVTALLISRNLLVSNKAVAFLIGGSANGLTVVLLAHSKLPVA
jgi:hypothetical protein